MRPAEQITQENGINLNVLSQTARLIQEDPEFGRCKFRAHGRWIGGTHNRTKISGYYAANRELEHKHEFDLHADEPLMLAGEDRAANPVEYLLCSLSSCLTTSLVAHAALHGIHIEELESDLEGDINLAGFLGLNPGVPKGFTHIRVKLKVRTDEDNLVQFQELTKFSPVLNTLILGTRVDIHIEPTR